MAGSERSNSVARFAATTGVIRPPVPGPEGSAASRKRGRPAVAAKAPRKSRARVPRLVPCYVNMGSLSLNGAVRYDAGQQRFDMEDLLMLAYEGEKGYATSRRMAVLRRESFFKCDTAGGEYGLVKWLDDPSINLAKGRKRETVAATAAAKLLRETQSVSAPTPRVGALACWLEQNAVEALEFLPVMSRES
jgi:hypothetical protein